MRKYKKFIIKEKNISSMKISNLCEEILLDNTTTILYVTLKIFDKNKFIGAYNNIYIPVMKDNVILRIDGQNPNHKQLININSIKNFIFLSCRSWIKYNEKCYNIKKLNTKLIVNKLQY